METRAVLTVLLALALGAPGPVLSAVLIEVDVSNPTAVTFTATGNASQVNDSSVNLYDGVSLVEFFTPPLQAATMLSISGSLAPPNVPALSYNRTETDIYLTLRTALCLYYIGGEEAAASQNFSTAAPAFVGVSTAGLGNLAAFLPGPGASGNVITGYSDGGSNAVLGQWAVVPEPSMLALGGIGASMVLLRRRNSIG